MIFYENSGSNLPYSRTFYHNCRIEFSFETACKESFSLKIKVISELIESELIIEDKRKLVFKNRAN